VNTKRTPPAKSDWSRRLQRPLVIPTVMTLKTLADVRELIRHVPAGRRALPTWQHVDAQLKLAAAGGEIADIDTALRLVLAIERVPCRPA
jgi:2-keto-3-deoxy-L-rhamnonate aldolase RhmA